MCPEGLGCYQHTPESFRHLEELQGGSRASNWTSARQAVPSGRFSSLTQQLWSTFTATVGEFLAIAVHASPYLHATPPSCSVHVGYGALRACDSASRAISWMRHRCASIRKNRELKRTHLCSVQCLMVGKRFSLSRNHVLCVQSGQKKYFGISP